MTVNSRSCTRSKVVKRAVQYGQRRRRRIAPRSSVGRESLTWVSSAPQNGQRISPSCSSRPVLVGQVPRLALPAINRKAGAEIADVLSYARLCRPIVAWPPRQRAQHLDDVAPDHAELLRAE